MQHDDVTNIHPMTLAEAQALLGSIGYRTDWTTKQLIAAVSTMPDDDALMVSDALRITAAAYQQEATELQAEARSKR